MAVFENFGKKVGKVANDAAAKSRELAEIARTSVSISDERSTIRMLYRDIGEKYYRELRDTDLEPLRVLCDKIDVSNERIRELDAKLNQIKGTRVCTTCGEAIDKRARFCPACGQPAPTDVGEAASQQAETVNTPET